MKQNPIIRGFLAIHKLITRGYAITGVRVSVCRIWTERAIDMVVSAFDAIGLKTFSSHALGMRLKAIPHINMTTSTADYLNMKGSVS